MMQETWMEVVPPPPVDHIASQSSWFPVAASRWTVDEDCRFEQELARLDLARPDWVQVARATPGKTVHDVVTHFEFRLLEPRPVLHHPRQTLAAEESTQGQQNQTQQQGRRLKQRSKVWKHFTRDTGDSGKEIAKCKRCGKEYAYHGTKNLWEHLEQCHGQEPAGVGAEQPPQPQTPL